MAKSKTTFVMTAIVVILMIAVMIFGRIKHYEPVQKLKLVKL